MGGDVGGGFFYPCGDDLCGDVEVEVGEAGVELVEDGLKERDFSFVWGVGGVEGGAVECGGGFVDGDAFRGCLRGRRGRGR